MGKIKAIALLQLPWLVAEVGLEPHDLRVMSPTSYQLLYSAIFKCRASSGINGARDRT